MAPYSSYSDEQLLELLRSGDERAFSEIYERYWEKMALHVLRVIPARQEAQDIVQEIFVSIWKRREVLEVKVPLVAYLLKSTRNLSLRYIEKNITQHRFLDRLAQQAAQLGPVEPAIALELQQLENWIAGRIEALPPKMKEVFLLSRIENLSYAEIAARLGIAENTVKKQISNALKAIRLDEGGLSATTLAYLIFRVLDQGA